MDLHASAVAAPQTFAGAAVPGPRARRAVIIGWGAWSLLAGLLLLGGPRHEPWFDEAQAWLIAKDSDPFDIVGRLIRYEGTPALWHLVLWTVQRLGLSYPSLYLVSATAALGGAWLVLFKAPFPLWMRVATIFSYFFAYQYAVVARSYALDLVLIPLAGWTFTERARRPIVYGVVLGLLANTNAHSFVVSAVLATEFAWARLRLSATGREMAALAIYGVLAVAAVLQAWPPHDPGFASAGGVQFMAARPVILFLEGLVDRADPFQPWGHGLHIFGSGVAISLLILLPLLMLAASARRLWLVIALLGALSAFFLFVYSNYWHSGMVFLVVLLCLWISWPGLAGLRADRRVWLLAGCATLLTYQVAEAATAWERDLVLPYSASRAAADGLAAIRRTHPADRIAAVGFKALAVEPYFAASPFANRSRAPGRFYRWRKDDGVPLYAKPRTWAAMTASGAYAWILLSPDTPAHDFDLPAYVAAARRSGYCVHDVFPGQLIWKTRVAEPDALVLFGRCKG